MKRFRCDLCAWGTLNMSGDAEKNASVFLVIQKSLNFVHFWSFIASLARFCVIKTFSAAPFVNVMGVLGAGRLFNLSRQRKIDAWPAAVLVVDEQNNIAETGPTHFPAYPLKFTATCPCGITW